MSYSQKFVDAIPEKLLPLFLKKAQIQGEFWYDMFLLCSTFGLRNIECRELAIKQIDWHTQQIYLTHSKSTKSHITKQANILFEKKWLAIGRRWLKEHIKDPHIGLIVRLVSEHEGLCQLAEEYGLRTSFLSFRHHYYQSHIATFRAKVTKTAPQGRSIDFSAYPEAKRILKKRYHRYHCEGHFLFPRDELKSHHAVGDKPVSRQTVYNIIQSIKNQLTKKCHNLKLGLHSCRKYAVQKVAKVMNDIFAASIWIGHGNGQGSVAMTERYLNQSQRRRHEIDKRLALFAQQNDYYDKDSPPAAGAY